MHAQPSSHTHAQPKPPQQQPTLSPLSLCPCLWLQRGVEMLGGMEYVKVDDEGLHYKQGKEKKLGVLPVDTVVVCAGQESEASLEKPLAAGGLPVFKIGGAHLAAELDAKRAIDQASRLAAAIEEAEPKNVGEYVAPLGMQAWLFQKIASRKSA